MFGRLHVEPVALDFLKAYPDINVRLILADHVVDMIENHVDLAVRIGALPDSSLVATRLGSVHWITCASPAYLAERGIPQTLVDLTQHDCIAFERLNSRDIWTFRKEDENVAVPFRPRFAVNTANGAIDAALAGAGIARVLSYQVTDAIADGHLVTVLPDFQPEPLPVHLVHTGQAILPLKLRAFCDFATPRLKARLAVS